jgi:hypothetical protein
LIVVPATVIVRALPAEPAASIVPSLTKLPNAPIVAVWAVPATVSANPASVVMTEFGSTVGLETPMVPVLLNPLVIAASP